MRDAQHELVLVCIAYAESNTLIDVLMCVLILFYMVAFVVVLLVP